MTRLSIELDELTERGYTVIPDVVDGSSLLEFESAIENLGRAQAKTKRIATEAREPLIDLLCVGGEYRQTLFELLKKLYVLQKISAIVGKRLEDTDFFRWSSLKVPLVWPTLRADLPCEETYLLPMHQDFATTRCHTAWRLWIPLRRVDEHFGTMKIVAGSHTRGIFPHDTSVPSRPYVDHTHYSDLPVEVIRLPPGHAVLFHPFILHESVPNRSDRIKFVLLLHVQDLATMVDPEDPNDELSSFVRLTREREASGPRGS